MEDLGEFKDLREEATRDMVETASELEWEAESRACECDLFAAIP